MKSFIKLRTKQKGGYYWRKVVCEGCPKACRYRDFRIGVPTFQEVYATLRAQHEAQGQKNCRFRYKRRGTILGIMHEYKRTLWEEYTKQCAQLQVSGETQTWAAPKNESVQEQQDEEEDLPW